jgi:hypothetical protein
MRETILKKDIIFGIIILLTSASLMPVLSGTSTQPTNDKSVNITPQLAQEKTTTMTFYVFEKTKVEKHTVVVSMQDAIQINTQFQELKKELAAHSYNEQTRQSEQNFLNLLEEKHALPTGISTLELNTLLQPPNIQPHPLWKGILPLQGQSSEWFCNFATTGTGAAFPIIILPRIIPFILIPIPRIFVMWSTPDGITSVGGLISHTGFIAAGQQKGLALGFWGIGFSIFLPPFDQYGIFGYALFARVSADYMEFWPPNNPPKITQTDPADGQTMVPLSTSELRFSISDADTKDRMSYNVTTNPDIGSGSGGLKPSGTYSISISGLESLTTYTWHISVTDGKDTTEKTLTFTTEPVAPVVSNPIPADGERLVPTELQQLQFTLKDFQGDAMDYTVQTSPFIGSGSGSGVKDGTFTVAVSGLLNFTTYRWYVNVTDGTHWTRKMFAFETFFPTNFDPFEHGWHYRKQLTIDHTNIPEDLTNFPVLVHITDNDLKMKAQSNGNDILFMNNTGYATRLNYEIEQYVGSTGTLIAWVNITQVHSNVDTIFYLYYGNPTSLSQQDPPKTWNSNYVGVWHFGETMGSTVADSTDNAITGTASTGAAITTGFIGNARNFDGSSGKVNLGTSSLLGGMPAYTIEAWVNPSSISGETRIYDRSQGGNPNTVLFIQDTGMLRFQTNNNDPLDVPGVLTVGTWYDVVGTFVGSGGEIALYADGMKVGTTMSTQVGPTAGSFPAYIGAAVLASGYEWHGKIDEIRFSKIARSSGWISVSYQNQYNPTGFLSVGPEVPGP